MEKEIYIRPESAWRKLRGARESKQAVYIFGATGYGKTALWEHFLGRKKHVSFHGDSIHSEDVESLAEVTNITVVIDDLYCIVDKLTQKAIAKLAQRTDIWLILVSRSPVPTWLMAAYISASFLVITEKDLVFQESTLENYFEQWNVSVAKGDLKQILEVTKGNLLAIRQLALALRDGEKLDEALWSRLKKRFWDYLSYYVYDKWDMELQEFFMEMSIVEQFDVYLAEMITGKKHVERLLHQAMETGNFLEYDNGTYRMREALYISMKQQLERRWTKERRNNLYYNAGLAYEISGNTPKALEMYGQCGSQERISRLLVDNARKNPGNGYFYELRRYYLALPKEVVKEEPELMAALSMLQAMLLNIEASEQWYEELKSYAQEQDGAKKRVAKSWLIYLDIALPHRGNVNLADILKAAAGMLKNRQIILPEFSVTSNLPSMMNGGKDFCEWTKRDIQLAKTFGKPVEFVLGRYGKGLVSLALAESFFEKGQTDNYEVLVHANRGLMQARSGGKLEQVFVGNRILMELYLMEGHLEEAKSLLEEFKEQAEKEQGEKMLPNIRAMECRFFLYQGDRKKILGWMKEAPQENGDFCTLERYRYLTKIRIYLMEGKYDLAINLLQRLLYYAEVLKRTYIRMESNLLLAIAFYREGDSRWKQKMQEVLSQAEEYHFVRLISREGIAAWELLNSGEAWTVQNQEFLDQVREETQKMAVQYPAYLKSSCEPDIVLSERALQILRLQAEGLSVAMIAKHLGIGENTVKYHTKQLYRKLGVNSRTAALAEARQWGLI